jgi:hypothetical protein
MILQLFGSTHSIVIWGFKGLLGEKINDYKYRFY